MDDALKQLQDTHETALVALEAIRKENAFLRQSLKTIREKTTINFDGSIVVLGQIDGIAADALKGLPFNSEELTTEVIDKARVASAMLGKLAHDVARYDFPNKKALGIFVLTSIAAPSKNLFEALYSFDKK